MKTTRIPFHEIPQTSRLFATFLFDFPALSSFYRHAPTAEGIAASAREVEYAAESRQIVAEVLRTQNRAFGQAQTLDASVERNLDRFTKGAVAVVTGQQVGLFSGPALTIYKALSAIRCARTLTDGGIDAVPVFWLATNDHDLAEVNESSWVTRQGMTRYELPATAGSDGRPVGQIALPKEVESVVGAALQTLEGPCAERIAQALRESYAPGETYGSAFAKLLSRLITGHGLLILDPQDERLARLSAPVYRAALESCDGIRAAILARSRDLEHAGFHAQVKVTSDATLLFYSVDGRREPIRQQAGGTFSVGSASFSKDALLAALEKNPAAFTASALLRPVLQDTLLPTTACFGGPAEIAYFAQSEAIYKKLDARMPAVLPRASFTLIEASISRFLDQYGLDIHDVLRGRQHLRAKMEQKAMPEALAGQFEADEESLRKLIQKYREPLERLDPTLVGAAQSTEEKLLGTFLKLKEKVGRAENFRTGVVERHERILLDALYPQHELQERHASILPHLAAHGPQLLDELCGAAPAPGSQEGAQHQVLFFD